MLVFLPLPNFSAFENLKTKQSIFIEKIFFFLYKTGLFNLLSLIYTTFWCLPFDKFKKIIIGLVSINLIFVFISKYYLVNFINNSVNSIFISMILFFGIWSIFCRFLLNFSLVTISYAQTNHKSLLSTDLINLMEGLPEEIPNSSTNPGVNSGPRSDNQYIFFQKNQNNVLNNASTMRKVGLFGAFCTLCFVGGTFYYTRMQGLETMRQNDLEEVSQGIMSKEDYLKKYPPKN